jgi:alpha-1,3-rhamnosyl/mannosyltransferase
MAATKTLIVNAVPLTYVQTGISRYLRCLYTEMERISGDELEIAYFDGKGLSSAMPEGPPDLARWSRLADIFWKLPSYAALLIRLLMQARAERRFSRLAKGFHVYHEAGFFPFKAPPGTDTVFTVHDLSLFRFPEHHPKERVLFARLFWKSRCSRVDRFLSVSEFTKAELQEQLGLADEKIVVTPLAHDPATFHPRRREQIGSFLHRKGLPREYFLFVGSGDPRKNLGLIIKALQAAKLNIPLIVAGWSGWSKERLPKDVISLGYVSDDELALLYSGALALVFPSTYEGFGLPLLEAMACGCPVVTTRKASLPEVAGEAAAYVEDPEDPEELAQLLQRLSSNPDIRRALQEKGLRRSVDLRGYRVTATRDLSPL